MHIVGADMHGARPGWRESGLIEEFRLDDAVGNPQRSREMWDLLLYDKVKSEPNITLLPMQWGPRLGLNLQGFPLLDFLVELAFCIACWAIFRGTKGLLVGIVVFNLLNIPLMFPRSDSFVPLAQHHNLLPTLILIQVVATWLVVWWLGRRTMIVEAPLPGPPG